MIVRPLLAAKATDEELQALFKKGRSYLMSPKIDGYRGPVVGGRLMSRTMKAIRNYHTQSLFGRPELEGLDGELVVGNPWDKNLMQAVSSGVGAYQGRPDVSFHVFDDWSAGGAFSTRLRVAHTRVYILREQLGIPLFPVEHTVVHTYEEMLEQEAVYLGLGYEGGMLRRLDGPYKQNRSTLREAYLVKVKRFVDGEMLVTGWEPVMHNTNEAEEDERGYTKRSSHAAGMVEGDMLGTLHGTDLETGKPMKLGMGQSTHAQRKAWLQLALEGKINGKIAKYKHFAQTGVKDDRRIAIFTGFRDKDDL